MASHAEEDGRDAELDPTPSAPGGCRLAEAPFDQPKLADVILQSSDKVQFYLSKVILTLASGFFKDMFSPDSLFHSSEPRRQIIDVSEDSKTLDTLLRFCYPVINPTIDDFPTLNRLLGAALKYDIFVAVDAACRTMEGYMKTRPMQAYKLACAHNLEPQAVAAALACRKILKADDEAKDFSETTAGVAFVFEMSSATAGMYFRLINVWRNGESVEPPSAVAPEWPVTAPRVSFNNTSDPQRTDTDISLRSSDGVTFHAHELILRLWGATSVLNAATEQLPDSRRLIQTDIHSETLSSLLEFCYPFAPTRSHDGKHFDSRKYNDVLDTASRLGMEPLVNTIRADWGRGVKTSEDRLGAYLLAARLGWSTEAQNIAESLQNQPLHTLYSRELERTPAKHYHALLEYHHCYQATICEIWKKSEYVPEVPRGRISAGKGSGWDKEWFTQAIGGSYSARSIPSVLVEADRVSGSPFDLQLMQYKSRIIFNEMKTALKAIKVNLGT